MDDGGIDWPHVLSLANTIQDEMREAWKLVPDETDEEMEQGGSEIGSHLLQAYIHLGRLIKRVRVMVERAGGRGVMVEQRQVISFVIHNPHAENVQCSVNRS